MMSTGHARGRSFHQGRVDTRAHAYRYGFNFEEQWQRAFELDPEVVFVTGWNEWIAMQLNKKDKGPVVFCDQYDLEMSRDVEMMNGGYGDNYYMQMAANIRKFKGMDPIPTTSPARTIDRNAPFSQWDDVTPVYRDHGLDTLPRDHAGCGTHYYRNQTGRNDFRVLKVTHDQDSLSFYAQTGEDISPHTNPNWMWLLIDVKGSATPSWEGFQFLVNRKVSGAEKTSLEICTGVWNWKTLASIDYRVLGNRMDLIIPKALLGIEGDHVTVEFKWIDNAQQPGNILDGYINGDTAPEGRFRYRYQFTSDHGNTLGFHSITH